MAQSHALPALSRVHKTYVQDFLSKRLVSIRARDKLQDLDPNTSYVCMEFVPTLGWLTWGQCNIPFIKCMGLSSRDLLDRYHASPTTQHAHHANNWIVCRPRLPLLPSRHRTLSGPMPEGLGERWAMPSDPRSRGCD